MALVLASYPDRSLLLYVAPGLAAISIPWALWLCLSAKCRSPQVPANVPLFTEVGWLSSDGTTLVLIKIVDIVAITSLLLVEVLNPDSETDPSAYYAWVSLYAYMFLLGVTSLFLRSYTRNTLYGLSSFLQFTAFIVIFALDAWPFATLSSLPYHSTVDAVTWIRLGVLTLIGVVIPLVSPRTRKPYPSNNVFGTAEDASILSRMTFAFLDSTIIRARRQGTLSVADLQHLPNSKTALALREKAFQHLDPSTLGRSRHLMWGILRFFGGRYVKLGLWLTMNTIAAFGAPLGLKNLLFYLESGVALYDLKPWAWIIVLGAGPIIQACVHTQYQYASSRIAVESESILTQLIFEHSLRIRIDAAHTTQVGSEDSTSDKSTATRNSDKINYLVGRVNNLITADVATIRLAHSAFTFPVGLLHLCLSLWFLYIVVGWSAWAGLFVLAVTTPLPTYATKMFVKAQRDRMDAADNRVQAVTEALSVLRLIKLFAWESYALRKLLDRRDDELKLAKVVKLSATLFYFTGLTMPLLAKLATLGIYAVVMKGDVSASRIFSALMVFWMMKQEFQNVVSSVPGIINTKIALERMSNFLNNADVLTGNPAPVQEGGITVSIVTVMEDSVGFKECSFSWAPFTDNSPTGENADSYANLTRTQPPFVLKFPDEYRFTKGSVNLVIGPTASGKTSVLMALLGEMYCKRHTQSSWYSLPRDYGIAYAPQESWIFSGTVRDNILFGEPFDSDRYRKVISQCALVQDFNSWTFGDHTEVGERGITLSGGQKARVTLARALFSKASVLLLDDVLAGLDVHTAKWIANEALQGDIIEGRTVILTTHNIALLAPIAKQLLVLGQDGEVVMFGSANEVLQRDLKLQAQFEADKSAVELALKDKEDAKDSEDEAAAEVTLSIGKLIAEEEKAIGRVNWSAIRLLVDSVGSPWAWTAWMGIKTVSYLLNVSQKWIVAYWSDINEGYPSSESPGTRLFLYYVAASFLEVAVEATAAVYWVFRSLRASKIIHRRLLESVFGSTWRWMDTTPDGRIIARCTQDINTIDRDIITGVTPIASLTISISSLFFSSVAVAGWSAFIPGLAIIGCGYVLGNIYLSANLAIRREMSLAKAPILSQVGTALSSLPTLRAYNAQSLFASELRKRIDILTRTTLACSDISRWMSLRMESLGGIFAATVSAYFLYGGHTSPGYAGFALTLVLDFSTSVMWWIRVYNSFEIDSNSLERVLEFMYIDHEPPPTKEGIPPAYWPATGDLRVEGLAARYSDDSPEVLKNISFHIQSGGHIGIVGRTGAGKSSFTLALLRAIKTSGNIFYDGIDISKINLDALRASITIIPQQPELMRGSVRENLDPFGQCDDAILNDVLQMVGLLKAKPPDIDGSTVCDVEGQSDSIDGSNIFTPHLDHDGSRHVIALDTIVESGGMNLSMGQRQLIALARALTRKSKLIILDEATSGIDYDREATIQEALQTGFGNDTTCLIIAHRLQSVMHCDKIMVLDSGSIVEFDSPSVLLKDTNSILRSLVDESGDRVTLLSRVGLS